MQLNVKFYKITWYSIICVALPGILLLHLHIHLTTTHLSPNRCGHLPVLGFKQQVWFGVYQCICANRWTTIFAGFWLGIFATKKACTSLAFWLRIDDKTGTLAYPVWCIVWVVQTQLFAENSNRGRKVSPEKSKSRKVHIPGDFCSKKSKSRKVKKFEKSKNSKSKSRKVHIPGDFCSKSRKNWKNRKIRKVEKSKSSHSKIHSKRFLLEKSKKSKNSKNSKSRKLFDFLTFCEKFCNFRAVRLPARGALSVTMEPPKWLWEIWISDKTMVNMIWILR